MDPIDRNLDLPLRGQIAPPPGVSSTQPAFGRPMRMPTIQQHLRRAARGSEMIACNIPSGGAQH